ncbi:hypothetical protein [Blastococcus sp. TF02A-26]|uniref:hypothetical protein n=1 Tax=Blastococcus sp. TF02A-26 TaxID=2250577 RepID=UPI0013146378|nr:hypothetical protein [Blastococcus sp. TF02A-26]
MTATIGADGRPAAAPDPKLTPARLARASEQFASDVAYATKAEEHVWVVAVTHTITVDDARSWTEGGQVVLGPDSIVLTHVRCFRCFTSFEPRLVGKRCRGARQ